MYLEFKTMAYDLGFSVVKVSENAKLDPNMEIEVLPEEVIFEEQLINPNESIIKVTLTSKEPCLLLLKWSNEHSWFTAKTLQYQFSILNPKQEEKPHKLKIPETWIYKDVKHKGNKENIKILIGDESTYFEY